VTAMTLRGVRAQTELDERGKRTGGVDLYGIATWLKREPLVHAVMSPAEARRLATQLLVAADRAEDAS